MKHLRPGLLFVVILLAGCGQHKETAGDFIERVIEIGRKERAAEIDSLIVGTSIPAELRKSQVDMTLLALSRFVVDGKEELSAEAALRSGDLTYNYRNLGFDQTPSTVYRLRLSGGKTTAALYLPIIQKGGRWRLVGFRYIPKQENSFRFEVRQNERADGEE